MAVYLQAQIVEYSVMRSRGIVLPNATVYSDILLFPIKFKCKLPRGEASVRPAFVSVANTIAEVPSNLLKVIYNKPHDIAEKKDIMICSKVIIAISFSILKWLNICLQYVGIPQAKFAPRFIEWIEFASLMGVKKVQVPVNYLGSTMNAVMKHYQVSARASLRFHLPCENKFLQDRNMLEMTQMTLPGFQPNSPTMARKFHVINGIIHTGIV